MSAVGSQSLQDVRQVCECVWLVVGWFSGSLYMTAIGGEEEEEEGVCAIERERCGLCVAMVTQENPAWACCPELPVVRQHNSPHFQDSHGTFLG